MIDHLLLAAFIFIAALLYSSVGHAGASGYLAAGAMFNLPQAMMRPAALLLNVIVASIGTHRFWRAGHISLRLLLPFAMASVPFAFIGGRWRLSDPIYFKLLGAVLLIAAINLVLQHVWRRRGSVAKGRRGERPPPVPVALLCGAGIGLLAGLTGVGGGIFLSPLLMLAGWADPKQTAGVSAPFILLNSMAGLAGQMMTRQFDPLRALPLEFVIWAAAAIAGGLLGSWLGARRLSHPAMRLLLALVLIIAGAKLLMA